MNIQISIISDAGGTVHIHAYIQIIFNQIGKKNLQSFQELAFLKETLQTNILLTMAYMLDDRNTDTRK